MLPDYPQTKQLIKKLQMKRFFSAGASAMGPFSDIDESPIPEGHRYGFIRENGMLDEIQMKKIEIARTIKFDEIEDWSEKDIQAYYEGMGVELGNKKNQIAYEGINQAVKAIGNEVDANGPPSADVILRTYEKMWIEFQENGQHVPLTLVCSPDAQPAFQKAFEQLENDPVLSKRFEELMQQKRSEWRERESARKLVG